MKVQKKYIWFIGVGLVFILSGCQTSYLGSRQSILPEDQLVLADHVNQSGEFHGKDLNFHYAYEIDDNDPGNSGVLTLEGKLDHNFRNVKLLKVWANQVDPSGRVLDRKLLYFSGYNSWIGSSNRISDDFRPYPGTHAIVFTTEYQTRENNSFRRE